MKRVDWLVGLGLCVGALAALPACTGDNGSPPRSQTTTATSATTPAVPPPAAAPQPTDGTASSDRMEADQLFMARCAACHGKEGHGDGPGSLGLDPKPRNYTDAVWQKTVTDEEIEKAIVYGGAAVGKSPQMVSNPDLQAKPGVVKALRLKIRKFGQP